ATVGLVCITDVSMQTNQQINSIIPNKEYYKYFLYLLMKSMGDELNNLASGGTATLNLNTGDFSNITFLSPSENELKIFHQSISSLFDKLKLNSKQINIIENLRDTLLPKLMSGEVRVQDAEEAIASVA
ncbi:TPA: restriction endonuclease subunit S, partial [Klebsiella pneumoniae]|nr:restriction endonuclease subunit S [Klebsiella pneumoniae]